MGKILSKYMSESKGLSNTQHDPKLIYFLMDQKVFTQIIQENFFMKWPI